MKVHRSRSVRRAKVIPDGKNLVSHAGAALLAELADRSGLTEAMSGAMAECGINWHTHDPGVVLTHLAVAIADGADCLADIAALKEQEELFGPVASVATAWRAVHATAVFELRAIPLALATARAARLGGGATGWPDDLGLRLDAAQRAFGEGGRRAHLQARLRVQSPRRVVRQHQRAPRRHVAPGQRRPQRHRRPPRTPRAGRPQPCPPSTRLGHEEGDDPATGRPPHLGPGRLGRGHPPLRRIPLRRQLRLLDRLPHQRFCA